MKEKKPLGLDSQGIQKTLRFSNYFGDGLGMIALNGISGLVSMLTFFYTDKIGIAAAAAGTIILGARVFDAITDLIMGLVVDRTKSRFGKARPWILYIAVPALIFIIALFCVPAGASAKIKNIYALITNFVILAVVYTAIAIPYGCLMGFVTKSTEERSKMGLFRALSGYIMGMIIAIALIPITNALGGDQKAWITVSAVIGTLAMISLIVVFFSNKEQNSATPQNSVEEERTAFLGDLKIIFRNKYLIIMAIVMFAINILYTISASSAIYLTKWVFKNENLIAILGAVGLIPVAIGFIITTPMIKKFGLAKTARIALLVGILGTIIRCFFPDSFISAITAGLLVTFGTIPIMVVGGVLVNNTVEYGEWKYGKRLVGLSNSVTGFSSKMGNGLGAALTGWVLAFGSYNADLPEQGLAAVRSIYALCIWIPGIVLVLVYFLLRFYDLDAKYPQIVKELEERKKGI
jgi:GPH family glycoside/pentoside/hexuronide:cation symporter